MANIPSNETYSSAIRKQLLPLGQLRNVSNAVAAARTKRATSFYIPSIDYTNPANLSTLAPITTNAQPGTKEYENAKNLNIFQYGSLVNQGQGIQSGKQFLTPGGDPNKPIPVPADYGSFMEPMSFTDNGQKLSWGTPTNPVIRNMTVGNVSAQYVEEPSDKNLLVKTNRPNEENVVENMAIRRGIPGFMGIIDHIMPLNLGGANTPENKQRLNPSQNYQKTKAQAIPYTLYAYGEISLSEARIMALQWKDQDISNIPKPNGIGLITDTGSKTGIEIAREAKERWNQKKVTFKDVMKEIPETMKNLGADWMPDWYREGIKGIYSGITSGFLPYEPREDVGKGAKAAGYIGMILGGFASFMTIGGAVTTTARIARWVPTVVKSFGALKKTANATAVAKGLTSAETTVGGTKILDSLTGAAKTMGSAGKIIHTTAVPEVLPYNPLKGFMAPLTPKIKAGALHFAVTSGIAGQISQFVQNKFNPGILSGEQFVTEQQNMIPRIIGDMIVGGVAGVAGVGKTRFSLPTLKGAALAMGPVLTLDILSDPDRPMDALTNAAIFGAMHMVGFKGKRADLLNLEQRFKITENSPEYKVYRNNMDLPAYNKIRYYNNWPEVKEGSFISESYRNPDIVKKAQYEAHKALYIRRNFDVAPDGSKAKYGMSDEVYFKELRGINEAAERLKRSGIKSPQERELAEMNYIIEFGKKLKSKGTGPNGEVLGSTFDEISENLGIPKAAKAAGEWILKNQEALIKEDLVKLTGKENYSTIVSPGTGQGSTVVNTETVERFLAKPGEAGFEAGWITLPRQIGMWLKERANIGRGWEEKIITSQRGEKYVQEPDSNPEWVMKIYGFKYNPKTNTIRTDDLGNFPGNERLMKINENINKFKERPADWIDFTDNKNTIVPELEKNKTNFILLNLDTKQSEAITTWGKKPFTVFNAKTNNWLETFMLRDHLNSIGIRDPYAADIARVNSLYGKPGMMDAVNDMKSNPNRTTSAADYIPRPMDSASDKLTMSNEATRSVLQSFQKSFNVDGPAELKIEIEKRFGIKLEDPMAQELFARKGTFDFNDSVNFLIKNANEGNIDPMVKVVLEGNLIPYMESGALQYSNGGRAILNMPVAKRGRFVEEKVNEPEVAPEVVAESDSNTKTGVQSFLENKAISSGKWTAPKIGEIITDGTGKSLEVVSVVYPPRYSDMFMPNKLSVTLKEANNPNAFHFTEKIDIPPEARTSVPADFKQKDDYGNWKDVYDQVNNPWRKEALEKRSKEIINEPKIASEPTVQEQVVQPEVKPIAEIKPTTKVSDFKETTIQPKATETEIFSELKPEIASTGIEPKTMDSASKSKTTYPWGNRPPEIGEFNQENSRSERVNEFALANIPDPTKRGDFTKPKIVKLAKDTSNFNESTGYGPEETAFSVETGWPMFLDSFVEKMNIARGGEDFKITNKEDLRKLKNLYIKSATSFSRPEAYFKADGKIGLRQGGTDVIGKLDLLTRAVNKREGLPEDSMRLITVEKNFDPTPKYKKEKLSSGEKYKMLEEELFKNGYLPLGKTGQGIHNNVFVKYHQRIVDMVNANPAKYVSPGEILKTPKDKFMRGYLVEVIGLNKGEIENNVVNRANLITQRANRYYGPEMEVALEVLPGQRIGDIPEFKLIAERFVDPKSPEVNTSIDSYDNGKIDDGGFFATAPLFKTLREGTGLEEATHRGTYKIVIDSTVNGERAYHKGQLHLIDANRAKYLESVYKDRGLVIDLNKPMLISFDSNAKIGPKDGSFKIPISDLYTRTKSTAESVSRMTPTVTTKFGSMDKGVGKDLSGERNKKIEELSIFNEESMSRKNGDEIKSDILKYADKYGLSVDALFRGIKKESLDLGAGSRTLYHEIGKKLKTMLLDEILTPKYEKGSALIIKSPGKAFYDGMDKPARFPYVDEIVLGVEKIIELGKKESDFLVVHRDPAPNINNFVVLKIVDGTKAGDTSLGRESIIVHPITERMILQGDQDADTAHIVTIGTGGMTQSQATAITKRGSLIIPFMETPKVKGKPATAATIQQKMRELNDVDDQVGRIATASRILSEVRDNKISLKLNKSSKGFGIFTISSNGKDFYTKQGKSFINEPIEVVLQSDPKKIKEEAQALEQARRYSVDSKGGPQAIKDFTNDNDPNWAMKLIWKKKVGEKLSELNNNEVDAVRDALQVIQKPYEIEKNITKVSSIEDLFSGSEDVNTGVRRDYAGLNQTVEYYEGLKKVGTQLTPWQEQILDSSKVKRTSYMKRELLRFDKAGGEAVIEKFGSDVSLVSKELSDLALKATIEYSRKGATKAEKKAARDSVVNYFFKNLEKGKFTPEQVRDISYWAAVSDDANIAWGYQSGGKRYSKNKLVYRFEELINADPEIAYTFNQGVENYTPPVVNGINISTKSSDPLGRALTNPTWGSKKDGKNYFDVESEYQAKKSKNPSLAGALRDDMNTMYNLQLKKFKQNPELIDEITARGGVDFLNASEHTVGVKNSRWEGKGEESNFIKVLIKAYEDALSLRESVAEAKPIKKTEEAPIKQMAADLRNKVREITAQEQPAMKKPPIEQAKEVPIEQVASDLRGKVEKITNPITEPAQDVAKMVKKSEIKPGDKVSYRGEIVIFRGKNPSGFAQLSRLDGTKMPGTPGMDKINLIGESNKPSQNVTPSTIIENKTNITKRLPELSKSGDLNVFTDGSDIKGTGQVGAGGWFSVGGKEYSNSITESSPEVKYLKEKFPDAKFSNPTMELLGISSMLHHLKGTKRNIVINTDLKLAINWKGLWEYSNGSNSRDARPSKPGLPYIKFLINRIVSNIEDIEKTGGTVKIQKVPGHSGILGNERVDAVAKDRNIYNNIKEFMDGGGGPGYHNGLARFNGAGGPGYDGQGGPIWNKLGSMLGSIKNTLSSAVNTVKAIPGNTAGAITKTWKNLSEPKKVMDFKIDRPLVKKPSVEMINVKKDNFSPVFDTQKPFKQYFNEQIKTTTPKWETPGAGYPTLKNTIAWAPEKVPVKVKGTNNDPYYPKKNRPNSKKEDIGRGAAGFLLDDSMVASSKQARSDNLSLPEFEYGTVLYVPELKKKFLVADLKGPDSAGTKSIDFSTPHKGGEVIPEYNKDFNVIILRKGFGKKDARDLVNSGEWEKLKNMPIDLPDSLL